MFEIVRLFYEILLFRKVPQDVPFSHWLTRLTLIAYAIISLLMSLMGSRLLSSLLEVAADILLLMAFTQIALAWVHKSERYQQTFCALLGTDALITLFAIPATAVMLIPGGGLDVLGFFVIVGLMLWHWSVIAHIFHHALDQTFGFSLGLALLYMMTVYWVMDLIFPAIKAVS